MTDDSHTLELGSSFGQHRILRLLGRGGMGEVYEVLDESGAHHALKLLNIDVMEVSGVLERFEREAEVMFTLDHPGIVKVTAAGETDGRYWIIMDLQSGWDLGGNIVMTLGDYVQHHGGKLAQDEVRGIIHRLLAAIGYAHQMGVVHRDLKPANVLLGADALRIADFGLVSSAGAEWMDTQVRSTVINQDDEDTLIDGSTTGSRSRAIMGTYAYMSPEQKKGLAVDCRSDLYSLGLMAFRMLTGMESPGMERASELGLGLDAGWDAWLIGTLKEKPDDRFPTASAMQEALDFRSAVSSVALKSESAPAPEAPKVRREPKPLPRPAPARPAVKPRREQPAAAPTGLTYVAPAKASRAWLYLCAVALVVGLFAWSPWESGVSEVDEDDNEFTSAPDPSREPSPAPVPAPEAPPPKPRTPPKKVLPAPVNLSTSAVEGKPFAIADLSRDMLWVRPGTFEMGSPPSEKDRSDDETRHTVTLTQGFYLGKYEVTQAQWQKVMGSNPSHFKGANRPVERVSWTDVTSFCDKLTALERKAGRLPAGMTYQLPTEAQWEYACRAGTRTAFSFGDELTSGQANIYGGPGATTDVGEYPANGWGFHDMHGNVFEWCADWYGDYPTGAVSDPVGPADGSYRVDRGGSWSHSANYARSALRFRVGPARSGGNLGFRLSLRPASK